MCRKDTVIMFLDSREGGARQRHAWARRGAAALGVAVAGAATVLFLQGSGLAQGSDGVARRLYLDTADDTIPTLGGLVWHDYLALVFMGLCLALASAGGVGGGPMLVPILAIFLDFPLKRATPMSNVIILGGGIANCAFNIMRAHPTDSRRPVIDFDLVITMVPAVVGGAVVGVFLSTISPSWIVAIVMVAVLGFSAFKTITKGKTMREKELAAKASAQAKIATILDTEAASAMTHFSGVINGAAATYGAVVAAVPAALKEKDKGYFEQMASRTPWARVLFLLFAYAGIVVLSVLAELARNKTVSWTLYWVELPWAVGLSIAAMVYVQRRHAALAAEGHQFAKGDVVFTLSKGARFLLQCIFTGAMAGLFGIGGGVFIGPLLVEMNVLPQVASATTAVLVLFAAAAAVVKFFLIGIIPMTGYSLLLFLMGLVITFLAQKIIMGYVRKSGAASLIVLSIGYSIAIGATLMGILAASLTIKEIGSTLNIGQADDSAGR